MSESDFTPDSLGGGDEDESFVPDETSHDQLGSGVVTRANYRSMQELAINPGPVQSLEPSFLRVVAKSRGTDESNMVTLPLEASVVQAAT